MMQTVITLQESARLELQGAMRLLQRALAEREFFLAQFGETDARQRHLLDVEIDESRRLVRHAKQEYESWERGKSPKSSCVISENHR